MNISEWLSAKYFSVRFIVRRNETFILLVKFYSKSLPGLTLPPSNDDCDSVARNGFTLGVFIELVAEILRVNVAGTLSGVA